MYSVPDVCIVNAGELPTYIVHAFDHCLGEVKPSAGNGYVAELISSRQIRDQIPRVGKYRTGKYGTNFTELNWKQRTNVLFIVILHLYSLLLQCIDYFLICLRKPTVYISKTKSPNKKILLSSVLCSFKFSVITVCSYVYVIIGSVFFCYFHYVCCFLLCFV